MMPEMPVANDHQTSIRYKMRSCLFEHSMSDGIGDRSALMERRVTEDEIKGLVLIAAHAVGHMKSCPLGLKIINEPICFGIFYGNV